MTTNWYPTTGATRKVMDEIDAENTGKDSTPGYHQIIAALKSLDAAVRDGDAIVAAVPADTRDESGNRLPSHVEIRHGLTLVRIFAPHWRDGNVVMRTVVGSYSSEAFSAAVCCPAALAAARRI